MSVTTDDKRTLILGPPGTGKTTALMAIIRSLLEQGYSSRDIGFVSYSRASVEEATIRVVAATGIEESRWPWFRTLHSAYSRILRVPKDSYIASADLKQMDRFELGARDEGSENGYDVPIKNDEQKRDDELRRALDWCRSRMVPHHYGVARLSSPALGVRYTDFGAEYKRLRDRLGKHDHTDILEMALANRCEIPVRVLIVDEAQDLSPLQVACVEITIEGCDRAWVAGDDDQAIYEFQGSSPDWLIALDKRTDWVTQVLGKSWRCPEEVRSRAEVIAKRLSNRASKPYTARDGAGAYRTDVSVHDAAMAIASETGSVLVLCRSRKCCAAWGSILRRRKVPYAIERGGNSPFGERGLRGVIDTLGKLHNGDTVTAGDLRWVAGSPWAPSSTKAVQGVFARGAKRVIKEIAAANPARQIDPRDNDDIADCGLDDIITYDPWHLLGMVRKWSNDAGDVREDLRWLRSAWDACGGAWPQCLPVVTTWHASKGREADLVVIDPSLPRPAANALESLDTAGPEHRTAYVALTRTRHTALIVEPDQEAPGAYPFPA